MFLKIPFVTSRPGPIGQSVEHASRPLHPALWPTLLAIVLTVGLFPSPTKAQPDQEPEVFIDSLHSFGFGYNWGSGPSWICEPIFRGCSRTDGLRQCLSLSVEIGEAGFGEDSIPGCVASRPGDTITMLGDFGIRRFIVDSVLVDNVCDPFVYCKLTPLHVIDLPKDSRKACLAILGSAPAPEMFIPYVGIDSALVAASDFETMILKKADSAQSECNKPVLFPTNFEYRGVEAESVPDTLFAFISAPICAGEWRNTGTYRLVRSAEGWDCTPLRPFHTGGYMAPVFIIHCAFDLNADGVLEYIVYRGYRREIINIIDDKIIVIAHSQEVRC